MRIAVCIKEVLDARVPVRVDAVKGDISQAGGPIRVINPADRAALELALSLKASGGIIEAFTVAPAGVEGALYYALARGVDAVERIDPASVEPALSECASVGSSLDPAIPASRVGPASPIMTALALSERLSRGAFDLVFCGDETLDNASAVVGPLIAEILGYAQVSSVLKIEAITESGLIILRKLEKGNRERVRAKLPLVATLVPEAMRPLYVSERRLELARRTPIPVSTAVWTAPPAASQGPGWAERERNVPPRARIKKRFAPDAKLSAQDRVKAIMSGGDRSKTTATTALEGDTAYLVEQLYRFLKHHEFI